MASIKHLGALYRSQSAQALSPVSSVTTSPATRPSAALGNPFDGAGTGRRMMEWQPTRLGPTTALWGTLDLLRSRSRDAIRNNPWAGSAIDNFEAQAIGIGIKPKWNIEDPKLKQTIEKEFHRWAISTTCDTAGRVNFYGLQALAAREIFEAGEVLSRFYVRPTSWRLRVPLQLQLIEAEQLPVFYNSPANGLTGISSGHTIRTGIEFDADTRRVAYHLYPEHPGETMFYPAGGLTYIRIAASDILHVYKPLRAGQLRGQPYMTAVLALLYELDKYSDAAIVKKQIQTMFAGFITKTDPESSVLPVDSVGQLNPAIPVGTSPTSDGIGNARLETGTLINLLPGENIQFPTLPQDNDIEIFMRTALHEFAAAIGATYEQITGDLQGVSYSSIRAGLLDFRRKCEQFQFGVMVRQFCQPIVARWLQEAWMSGVLSLPGYAKDPWAYEDITWATAGWDWVDPLKDVQAAIMEIRAGLDSRENKAAERGRDADVIDAQQVIDNKRADAHDLVYDSDGRKVLLKGRPTEDPEQDGNPASGSGSGSSKPAKPKKSSKSASR